MQHSLRPIPVQFWRSAAGIEPGRDWFRSLSPADRAVVGDNLRRLQFGWPVGMPLVKSLGSGMWELRSSLPSRQEARVLFAVDSKRIVVLHCFIKKSQKIPPGELAVAKRRYQELTS